MTRKGIGLLALMMLPSITLAQHLADAANSQAITAVVNTTNDIDDGVCDNAHCSLREAIIATDNAPGLDTIAFDIPGPGPHTIQPVTALPVIFDPVIIDGTTEPDYAGTPVIELDGSLASDNLVSGLVISAGDSTVRALVINRFRFAGILFGARGNNVAEGNYIGADVTGTQARGNRDGIYLLASANNRIGGANATARNLISGNNDDGINPNTSSGTIIQGNFIGTDVTGTHPLPNRGDGIKINRTSNHTLIGGTMPGEGNIIAFNKRGVYVEASPTPHTGNAILGNSIFSNNRRGISLSGDESRPVLETVMVGPESAIIGGGVTSAPNTTLHVEFFANARCNGNGDGETYLGYIEVTTDDGGSASFTAHFEAILLPGEGVTATATDTGSNTSEFSACIELAESRP